MWTFLADLCYYKSFKFYFIDDYSCHLYPYLLNENSESPKMLDTFREIVEIYLDHKIKVMRMDMSFVYYGQHTDVG